MPKLSPQRKKELTLAALIRWLEGLARRQPVVVVFEDAHWVDPTSRELLDLTIERIGSLSALRQASRQTIPIARAAPSNTSMGLCACYRGSTP